MSDQLIRTRLLIGDEPLERLKKARVAVFGVGGVGGYAVEALARSGALDVIVVDSVAALVPRAEIDGDMGDSHVGLHARLMSQALRKLTGVISKSNTVIIFINQLREKVGVVYGNPEVTTGGRALKFYSTMRIDVRRVESLKGTGGEFVGSRTKVKIVKNKVAPPFKTAEFDIMYGEGISRVGEVLDAAVNLGVVKKSGAWFSYNGERLGQGRDNVKNLFRSDEKLCAEIEKQVREQMANSAQAVSEKTVEKAVDPADEPIAYKPVATTKAAARAKIDVAVDDDE